MDLTYYQIFRSKLDNDKYIHTENSSNSKGTKLVINTDKIDSNYAFLLFPENPAETSDKSYFIVHTNSGRMVGAQDGSSKEDKDIELANFTGNLDQLWSFNRDGNYYNVENGYGYNWKLQNGETSNGTKIEQHSVTNNDNSYFDPKKFENADGDFPSIPDPSLAEYAMRTENPLNDTSLIPSDPASQMTTQEVLIGECSIPFFYIKEDRTLSAQVEETPYYVLKRLQYWTQYQDTVQIFANSETTIDDIYFYGAKESETEELTKTTSMEITADLGISYGVVSAGLSGTIGQSLEVMESSTNESYSEVTKTITTTYYPEDYDRTLYFWQVVDVIRLEDGTGKKVFPDITMPANYTYTQCISS